MKKFLVIGNGNAVTYSNIFPLIRDNQLWLGVSPRSMDFVQANGGRYNVNACWFTNLEHTKRHKPLVLHKKYTVSEYPKYDNYDAVEVSKVCDIPMDYDGVMGVPISFLDKYCPEQFEILWLASGHSKTTMPAEVRDIVHPNFEMKSNQNTPGYGIINGHQEYHRILIRKK